MFILFDSMNFINYLHVIYPTHILVILHKKSSCKTIGTILKFIKGAEIFFVNNVVFVRGYYIN